MRDSTDAESATKLLPNLAAFAAVLEAGSYSAAARRLGVDKTLISRRVMTLEKRLGVRLLHRTTRSISPTDAGQRLYDQARAPLREAITAVMTASDPQQIEGTVRVATFAAAGAEPWADVIATLRRDHPRLFLELRAGDPYVDLVDQGIDLALRSGNMPDSSMIATRIGSWGFVSCATPDWLEANAARIRHPDDIAGDWILFGNVARADQWRFSRRDDSYDLKVHPVTTVDSFELQQQLVLAGVGVAALPVMSARASLESGRLVRVLPDWRIDHVHGLWAVLPTRAYTPPRVRAVIDALKQRVLALQPQWDAVVSEQSAARARR